METRKLICSGLVQGVGFRWSTMALANKMGIPGTVKNNADGTVTIYLQADSDKIDRFIEKTTYCIWICPNSKYQSRIGSRCRKNA